MTQQNTDDIREITLAGGPMPDEKSEITDRSQQLKRAIARWENDGGSAASDETVSEAGAECDIPQFLDVDVIQLRIRVIALENIVIALLAESSERQRELVREMASYISPRSGFALHPLTIRAANLMRDIVERAGRFCS